MLSQNSFTCFHFEELLVEYVFSTDLTKKLQDLYLSGKIYVKKSDYKKARTAAVKSNNNVKESIGYVAPVQVIGTKQFYYYIDK